MLQSITVGDYPAHSSVTVGFAVGEDGARSGWRCLALGRLKEFDVWAYFEFSPKGAVRHCGGTVVDECGADGRMTRRAAEQFSVAARTVDERFALAETWQKRWARSPADERELEAMERRLASGLEAIERGIARTRRGCSTLK